MLGGHEREWLDYLCGNHSRNLHFDAFLRLFEGYIKVLPPVPYNILLSAPQTQLTPNTTLPTQLSCAEGKIGPGIGSGPC
jgi:hypothetical protein